MYKCDFRQTAKLNLKLVSEKERNNLYDEIDKFV